jgi:hypothetical protein
MSDFGGIDFFDWIAEAAGSARVVTKESGIAGA